MKQDEIEPNSLDRWSFFVCLFCFLVFDALLAYVITLDMFRYVGFLEGNLIDFGIRCLGRSAPPAIIVIGQFRFLKKQKSGLNIIILLSIASIVFVGVELATARTWHPLYAMLLVICIALPPTLCAILGIINRDAFK